MEAPNNGMQPTLSRAERLELINPISGALAPADARAVSLLEDRRQSESLRLAGLAYGLENQSRHVSKGIPGASPVSIIPVVSRRTRK